jgi:hypothetical protein
LKNSLSAFVFLARYNWWSNNNSSHLCKNTKKQGLLLGISKKKMCGFAENVKDLKKFSFCYGQNGKNVV